MNPSIINCNVKSQKVCIFAFKVCQIYLVKCQKKIYIFRLVYFKSLLGMCSCEKWLLILPLLFKKKLISFYDYGKKVHRENEYGSLIWIRCVLDRTGKRAILSCAVYRLVVDAIFFSNFRFTERFSSLWPLMSVRLWNLKDGGS